MDRFFMSLYSRMSRLVLVVFTFLFSSGHSQECQTVGSGGRLFVLPNSSYCVNCPFMNEPWMINLAPLTDFVSASEHEVFPNNSLLMRRSVAGSYQCGTTFPNIHQFDVEVATNTPPFINDPTVYNESEHVTLTCQSDGMPSAVAIRWQRNDVTISPDFQLTFNPIQRNNASVYTCCIDRIIAGRLVTVCDDFTITVQYPPMISSLSPTNGRAPVNTHHIIQCTFEGIPIPTVVWAHNGNVLSDAPNDTSIATGDTSSTLTITMVTADDSGSYTCMVSNLLGSNMGSSMLLVQFPPDPPSEVMVVAMTTQLSLSWTNAFDGYSPITMVMITYGQQTGSNDTVTAASLTSHNITGLMPNMEYMIFLQSFNDIGASELEMETGMTTPLSPGAPTVTLTALSSTSIRVSWNVTITSSMTAVTVWTVRYYPTGSSSDVKIIPLDANVNEYVLTELDKGTSYTVSVAANNSAGRGQFTEEVKSTMIDPPSEPTNLTAEALSHSRVRVTWAPVSDDGGSDVEVYRLVVNGPAGLSSGNVPEFSPDTRDYIIEDLTNNTVYTIHLSARNPSGYGPNATVTVETLDIGVPDPPTLMESSSSDLSIVVTWNRPMDIDISHYQIEYKLKIDSEWTQMTVDATLTSYEITNLSPSTTYEVRIFAFSIEGVSSVAADAVSITTEAQPPVMIEGATNVPEGRRLELTCLLMDGGTPYDPQWRKDSGSLPDHVIVGGTNGHVVTISSVTSSDAGEYTCTNGESSDIVNVTITMPMAQSGGDDELGTTEYILIGIGAAILLGILILFICICCICHVRRRRPKIYSPSKGSNWIDGDGHTGIVFMASSYSSSQSPSQREDTTDAPYLMGCKEDEFHNTSTFNTLERSAIHSSYQQSDQPQNHNNSNKSHQAHYAELDLAPSSKYAPPSTNSVQYSQIDKSSFKQKRSLSPPHTKAVPVPVETPTAAAAKRHYDNPTYAMSSSYHYPVTPGDTVV